MTKKPAGSNFIQRAAVAVFGIPLIFWLVATGGWHLFALVELVMAVSLYELYRLAQAKGFYPSWFLGIPTVSFLGLAAQFHRLDWLGWSLFLLVVLTLIVELFKNRPHALANTAITIFGVQYLALFAFFIPLRRLGIERGMGHAGAWIVFAVLVSIWVCDTAAYGFGLRFGKHPLFKRVSPKKTWEGAIAGFVFAIISVSIFKAFWLPFLNWYDMFFFGFIVGVLGQLSDLVESLFKRDAGVKDSSSILPGHGGFLDRFDSLLLVGPVVYLYLCLRHLP
jgi:phosphatidate cytidylyltransferase